MYLSKLSLNIGHPSVRQALRDCHDMHRNLMRAFDQPRKDAQMLYRLTVDRNNVTVYVLSGALPVWERLANGGIQCLGMKDLSPLVVRYGCGDALRFTLLACPAKKVRIEGRNSRRVFLREPEERLEWLRKQARKGGFEIVEAHETGVAEKLTGDKPSGRVAATAILFEGVLKITDGNAFWTAYQSGIGPELSYGAGLLMLAKVR